MSSGATGTIVQCIGAVVDIEFPRDQMPEIYDALILDADPTNKLVEQGLTFEVQQQLGDGIVRTIAMGSSDGLRRGMAEYNATRKRAGSFLNLAKSPSLATEVTLQPVERFPLDAAILFSDILTVPDAMGLGLYFAEGEGPKFERPVRTEADVGRLAVPDPELTLGYVMDAVREIRRALANRIPLIGFSGSPFTLACYMSRLARAREQLRRLLSPEGSAAGTPALRRVK